MNVNEIVRIVPTLKVNNRKLNERFYIETLGMKPLLEESAFISLRRSDSYGEIDFRRGSKHANTQS